MNNTIVTYETFHGSAKKIAEVISKKLECKCINIDTPFEAEDLHDIDNLILVFNFRGPYTAQLTKLYLNRVKEQLKSTNVILVGEGLFSEKEFPVVADEIYKRATDRYELRKAEYEKQGINFEKFATGHYARLKQNEQTGLYQILRGCDNKKDQSYFLYRLSQEQLSQIILPLGDMEKSQIRELAKKAGLEVSTVS